MKIRTQFIIVTSLFLVLLTGVSASLIITDAEFARTDAQQQMATDIEQDARELDYMTNDYLLYREAQGRARWETSFDNLSAELDGLRPQTAEQQAINADMQTNRDRLGNVFADVAATVDRAGQTPGGPGDTDFMRVSWSRLEVQNQGLVFDATQLRQLVTTQADNLQARNRIFVYLLMLIITAYIVYNYVTIYRRALGGVARLEAGTKVIGAGDLDHRITVGQNDEIGELIQSFNQMTANLRTVTASRTELERAMVEREKAELALELKVAQLNSILISIPNALTVYDKDGRIVITNQNSDGFLAYTETEKTLPMTERVSNVQLFDSLMKPVKADDRPAYRALNGETVLDQEFYVTREGREPQWITSSAAPILADGVIVGAVATVTDITDRKKAEAALAQSEERFRTTFDKSMAVMLLSDPLDFRILQANEAAASFYGFPTDVLVNMKLTELNTLPVDEIRARVGHVLAGKGEVTYAQHRLRTGEIRWVQVMSSPIRIGEQKLVFSVIQDITERKKAEEALRESEENFRRIVETASEGIWVAAPDGRATFVNQRMADMLGYTRYEIIGRTALDLMAEDQREKVVAARRKLRAGGMVREQFCFRHKNGAQVWTSTSVTPMVNDKGEHIGNLAMHTDITDRKKAEAELVHLASFPELNPNPILELDASGRIQYLNPVAKTVFTDITTLGVKHPLLADWDVLSQTLPRGEALAVTRDIRVRDTWFEQTIVYVPEINTFRIYTKDITERKQAEEKMVALERLATIGQLSGSIAHEIRNPLAVVDSSAFMLRRLLPNADEKVKTHLERMNGGVRRCLDIIEALLNLTRLGEPKAFPVDLKEFTTRMIEEHKPAAGITVLPEFCAGAVTIRGDQEQLRMVFRNLITNAAQAMNGQGTLRVAVCREGEMGRLTVADTGPGISPENREKIFQPLFSTKTVGIGLGLAITQKIIEKHHGTITVEPEEGWGAVFVVRLPLNGT